jgi:rare lipoprotein A
MVGASVLGAGQAQADIIKYKEGDKFTSEASTYGWGEKLNDTRFDGGQFKANEVAVAMRNIPMGSVVEITDKKTGKKIEAIVNDGGPAHKTKRQIDLTKGAWKALGYKKAGLTDVDVKVKKLGKGKIYYGHTKKKKK